MVKKLCVYEAVNRTAREVVLGLTDTCSLEQLQRDHARSAPVWIARWKASDDIAYRLVECELDPGTARAFLDEYRRCEALSAYKVHVAGHDSARV